jgi:hypothetical protein
VEEHGFSRAAAPANDFLRLASGLIRSCLGRPFGCPSYITRIRPPIARMVGNPETIQKWLFAISFYKIAQYRQQVWYRLALMNENIHAVHDFRWLPRIKHNRNCWLDCFHVLS